MPRKRKLHPGSRIPKKGRWSYPNARICSVYEDGSYSYYIFFIVKPKYVVQIMELFDSGKDNCNYALRSEMTDFIRNLCDKNQSEIWRPYIGVYNGKLFLYTKDHLATKFLNRIAVKATDREAGKLIKFVLEKETYWQNLYHTIGLEEEEKLRQEQENAEIEERFNNPSINPGIKGEFSHYYAEEIDNGWNNLKKYSLKDIKTFFELLYNSKYISTEIKKEMIFYGGTIPYLLCNKRSSARKFGDIDIYLPANLMEKFRKELKEVLSFIPICDSLTLFKYEIYKGGRRALNETFAPRDYGFKGKLYGVQVSVFPLFDKVFDDGSTAVCSKSCRIGRDNEWNYLLDLIIVKNTTIEEITEVVNIDGREIKIIKPEYTIASKRNAINYGKGSRQLTDEQDLRFFRRHSKELIKDRHLYKFFMQNIPMYAVYRAYAIAYVYDAVYTYGRVEMMDGEHYVNRVIRNKDESVNHGIS